MLIHSTRNCLPARHLLAQMVPKQQAGVTLLELMVALAILAIGTLLASASFGSFSASSRLSSATSELQSALQYARSESIRLNAAVVFCHSSDGQSCSAPAATYWQGWLIRAAGATAGAETGPVLRANSWTDEQVKLSSGASLNSAGHAIRFNSLGLIRTFTSNAPLSGQLKACIADAALKPNLYQLNFSSAGVTEVLRIDSGGTCE